MKAKIGGIVGFSTLDYPGRPSAVVFMGGCPFKCPFCQNPDLVELKGECKDMKPENILEMVKENKRMVDAIVFTGGEPLHQPEALKRLLILSKKEKFLTKLDTNGFYPERLSKLLKFLDYVAIDVKAALKPEKYSEVIGKALGEQAILNLRKSIKLIKESGVKLEIRTTIIPDLVGEDDVKNISQELRPKKYYLQQFRPDKTLNPEFSKYRMPSDEELEKLAKLAKKHGAHEVWIRGGTTVRT